MKLDDRKVVELNLDDILPNRFQPRITFSEDAINDLAESIKEHGVIQPIVVRKINDKYEIIAGERRYKASRIAGKQSIPAIVTDLNDKESAEIALIENVQREDLTPIEEAVSYKKILDMGYLTQEELSNKLGKQQSTISNKLRLLNLDEEVQEALLEKKISERHARSLLRLSEKEQRMMLNRIVTERLTVRKADDEIDKLLNHEKTNKENLEVEILELDENENEGENTMNEQTNNNFNIPTSPIVEENNVVPGIDQVVNQNNVSEPVMMGSFNIPESTIIEQIETPVTSMNPGFMDVDKIANTAEDINVEKPVADLNSLLQPTPSEATFAEPKPVDASIFGFTPTVETTTVESHVEKEENNNEDSLLQPGKFFDLSGFVGEKEEEQAPVLSEISNAINPSLETPTVEISTPEVKENNGSSMFGINLEPKNPEFISNVETGEANMDFNIPKPEVEANNFNFDSFFTAPTTPEAIEEDVETTPVVETPQVETPMVENAVNTTEILNNVENTQTQDFSYNIPEVQAVAAPVPPVTPPNSVQSNYEVPSADELDNFLSNLDSSTPLSGIAATVEPESNATIVVPASVLETGAPEVNNNVQDKMDQVVVILREAKDKITALGINVELDEFDFDDMYQAIIKIDK